MTIKKKKEITVLYNKLQFIVLQSCYKITIKCKSDVEYNLTSWINIARLENKLLLN